VRWKVSRIPRKRDYKTYRRVNDDIVPTEEERRLSRIQPVRNLLKEEGVVRPIKVLSVSLIGIDVQALTRWM
jgi:hypothetical protein